MAVPPESRRSPDARPIGLLKRQVAISTRLHGTDPAALSADGYELTFATNHLGHYLLLRLLTWPELSELARRDHVADALWRDSEVLVGLPEARG